MSIMTDYSSSIHSYKASNVAVGPKSWPSSLAHFFIFSAITEGIECIPWILVRHEAS